MILTGRCKKEFNNWRFITKKFDRDNYVKEYNDIVIIFLVVDWFDSIGYNLYTSPVFHYGGLSFEGVLDGLEISEVKSPCFKTRREALESIIKISMTKYNNL